MYVPYLDNRVAEYWRSDVTNPHTQYHRHKHVGDQDSPRSGASFAENESSHHLCDVKLGQRCCNCEATEEQHNNWSPHGREDVLRCIFWVESVVRLLVCSNHPQNDGQKWDQKSCDEQWYDLAALA